MDIYEFVEKLKELYPDSLACEWDNDGLMCSPGAVREVSRVLVALDATEEAIEYAAKNGKLIGAICAAPSILGKAGLLCGKRATCFPGFEKYLDGAIVCDMPVVRDGNIITSRGAGAALEFGFNLLAALKDDAAADSLRRNMKYI